jgi:hypothetical protein
VSHVQADAFNQQNRTIGISEIRTCCGHAKIDLLGADCVFLAMGLSAAISLKMAEVQKPNLADRTDRLNPQQYRFSVAPMMDWTGTSRKAKR